MKRAGFLSCILLGLVSVALFTGAGVASAEGTTQPATPTAARVATVGTAQVAAGEASSYAIKPDGSLWAWGANGMGQLGLGNTYGHGATRSRLLPQRVGKANSWRTLAAGSAFCLALKSDGSLWAWPYSTYRRPTRVGTALWRAIGAGNEFSAAIRRDGSLWTWGSNFLGQLGISSTDAYRAQPTRVGSDNDWKAIAVGYDWVLALKRDGSLWAWGGNEAGQLGIGSADPAPDNEHPAVPHPTPIRIGSDTDWSAVAAGAAASFALKRDGSLWAWGRNADDGQLGLGDTLTHWLPTRVGTAKDWRVIAAGNSYGLGLKRNGSLWAWGEGPSGQLGLGDAASRHRPTRVGHSTQWLRIAAANASLAVKRDGTTWSWGDNFTGQLGLGNRHNRLAPTRITHLR